MLSWVKGLMLSCFICGFFVSFEDVGFAKGLGHPYSYFGFLDMGFGGQRATISARTKPNYVTSFRPCAESVSPTRRKRRKVK